MNAPLAPNLFSNPEKVATRDGFGKAVLALAEKDSRIIALSGDLNDSTKLDGLREKFPERFIQAGIAEQDMVGLAAGLSLSGLIPFAATFGAFLIRAADHIRVSVAFSNLNVKLAATHCGVTVGEDGGNAQMLEDIAFMRSLPNMTVLVPADSQQAFAATVAAAGHAGPVYLRLGRESAPVIFPEGTPFEIGKAQVIREGSDVALIACGGEVYQSLLAAELLKKEGLNACVVNCHTIKPLDRETLTRVARTCGAVVTAEEHQVNGGLGGAVAELLAKTTATPMEFVAVQDSFGESGKGAQLLEKFGLTAPHIVRAAKLAIKRKR